MAHHAPALLDPPAPRPHRHVCQRALDRLGVIAKVVACQSSNAWEAHAALGMRAMWCNRYGQCRERLPGTPDHEIQRIAELPALLAPPD